MKREIKLTRSTLHVLPRLISHFLLISIFIYFSGQCLVKYLRFEVGTRVDYVYSADETFPAFAICWKIGYKRKYVEQFGMKRAHLLQEGKFPSNTTVYELLNQSRLELSEFLNNITLETFSKVDLAPSVARGHLLAAPR